MALRCGPMGAGLGVSFRCRAPVGGSPVPLTFQTRSKVAVVLTSVRRPPPGAWAGWRERTGGMRLTLAREPFEKAIRKGAQLIRRARVFPRRPRRTPAPSQGRRVARVRGGPGRAVRRLRGVSIVSPPLAAGRGLRAGFTVPNAVAGGGFGRSTAGGRDPSGGRRTSCWRGCVPAGERALRCRAT